MASETSSPPNTAKVKPPDTEDTVERSMNEHRKSHQMPVHITVDPGA